MKKYMFLSGFGLGFIIASIIFTFIRDVNQHKKENSIEKDIFNIKNQFIANGSSISIVADKNGCEYLINYHGGITPSYDFTGYQMGCSPSVIKNKKPTIKLIK